MLLLKQAVNNALDSATWRAVQYGGTLCLTLSVDIIDVIPLCIFHIYLHSREGTGLIQGINVIELELQHEIEEPLIPHLYKHGLVNHTGKFGNELLILLIEVPGEPYRNLIVLQPQPHGIQHAHAHIILLAELHDSLLHISRQRVHIRHGKGPQSPQSNQFPALFLAETVPGHLDHL